MDVATSDTVDVVVKLSGAGNSKVRLREGREESWTQTGVPVKEPVEVVASATISRVNSV